MITKFDKERAVLAAQHGFSMVERNTGRVSFECGNFNVWSCVDTPDLNTWWQSCYLKDGQYVDHKRYENFEDALRRER